LQFVCPSDIEALLYHHPKVQQACVVGVPKYPSPRGVHASNKTAFNSENGLCDDDFDCRHAQEDMVPFAFIVPTADCAGDPVDINDIRQLLCREYQYISNVYV
jgi:acyl-CoA synthetase (AMP-forming)/AMP-acid ligase II